jgi:hypothetical protein
MSVYNPHSQLGTPCTFSSSDSPARPVDRYGVMHRQQKELPQIHSVKFLTAPRRAARAASPAIHHRRVRQLRLPTGCTSPCTIMVSYHLADMYPARPVVPQRAASNTRPFTAQRAPHHVRLPCSRRARLVIERRGAACVRAVTKRRRVHALKQQPLQPVNRVCFALSGEERQACSCIQWFRAGNAGKRPSP